MRKLQTAFTNIRKTIKPQNRKTVEKTTKLQENHVRNQKSQARMYLAQFL